MLTSTKQPLSQTLVIVDKQDPRAILLESLEKLSVELDDFAKVAEKFFTEKMSQQ